MDARLGGLRGCTHRVGTLIVSEHVKDLAGCGPLLAVLADAEHGGVHVGDVNVSGARAGVASGGGRSRLGEFGELFAGKQT